MGGSRRALVAVLPAIAAGVTGVERSDGVPGGAPPHLNSGQRLIFPAGVLRAGDLVTCASRGIHIGARVPGRGSGVPTIADGPRGSATLAVKTRSNGSVVARCR